MVSYWLFKDACGSPNGDPYDHPALAEVLVILSIVTSPVRGREAFIRDLLTPQLMMSGGGGSPIRGRAPAGGGGGGRDWIVVDSDGEEEPGSSSSYMKENDLVAILNQMPIGGTTWLPIKAFTKYT